MIAAPACPETLQRISAYLDGELDAGACDEVERHCRDCAACASVVEGLRRTVGICREAGAAPLPDAVRQRARDRVRTLLSRRQT
jgi:anti-sigma factor RsiW